jgi:hypothetical protein
MKSANLDKKTMKLPELWIFIITLLQSLFLLQYKLINE